jgi:hypothetical protein
VHGLSQVAHIAAGEVCSAAAERYLLLARGGGVLVGLLVGLQRSGATHDSRDPLSTAIGSALMLVCWADAAGLYPYSSASSVQGGELVVDFDRHCFCTVSCYCHLQGSVY